ncbi:hypothetical protein EV193_111111 [Herbihabitans rhizosphaerae]|uniref:Uncharacterized protein n=1 Tax=Herbihabitans rhizosphaerae TaxID=1872711 RepID=A0A4Q7KGL9_9PSEU|nr:hypothetical protein [Herbihabitans rhizosphaerae]RZS32726.1 hypothetical protein EV193_111111 [Herbihabitans rhizosphaerae]
MGAWSTGLFDNDTAADVRSDYEDLVARGHTPDDAVGRLETEYGDDPDLWLALAATQHELGAVSARVRDRAEAIIDNPRELDRWAPESRSARESALTELRGKLRVSGIPPRKRPRRRTRRDTDLTPGQHVVVRVPAPVLFRVVRIHEDKGGRHPVLVLVRWDGDERTLAEAHRLPPVPNPKPLRKEEALGFLLVGDPLPAEQVQVLPVVADDGTPSMRWYSQLVVKWTEIAGKLP